MLGSLLGTSCLNTNDAEIRTTLGITPEFQNLAVRRNLRDGKIQGNDRAIARQWTRRAEAATEPPSELDQVAPKGVGLQCCFLFMTNSNGSWNIGRSFYPTKASLKQIPTKILCSGPEVGLGIPKAKKADHLRELK